MYASWIPSIEVYSLGTGEWNSSSLGPWGRNIHKFEYICEQVYCGPTCDYIIAPFILYANTAVLPMHIGKLFLDDHRIPPFIYAKYTATIRYSIDGVYERVSAIKWYLSTMQRMKHERCLIPTMLYMINFLWRPSIHSCIETRCWQRILNWIFYNFQNPFLLTDDNREVQSCTHFIKFNYILIQGSMLTGAQIQTPNPKYFKYLTLNTKCNWDPL